MSALLSERLFRQALVWIAIAGLLFGLLAWTLGRSDVANWCWAGGTVPVVIGLLVSMVRDFLAGRLGVDAVAFVSMSGALALGQNLAGIVVALMYAGGNLLEDLAVARAERDLRSLIDRAPRRAHRRSGSVIEDVPIEQVAVGDEILVRAGDVIPVDGIIVSPMAMLDEAAVTGEPVPVNRQKGELARSGSLNAGEVFELRASTTANESTYAGIVRMVSAAQTAKAPFVRMADRYALLLLPLTLITAGVAWYFSGDPIRALAVLVASTPCPLILAAPVAFIAGVAQAAKRGILVKGSGSLEALARTHTVIFAGEFALKYRCRRLLCWQNHSDCEPKGLPLGAISEFSAVGIVVIFRSSRLRVWGILMHIRSGPFKSINRGFPYLGRGCIVILAVVLIITAELSVSTSWSAASSMATSMETVNRTHKTDRLPLPALHRDSVNFRLEHPAKLPVGCESVASSITRSPLAETARYCLS